MWIETLCIAFSMFSRLPVPQVPWNEKNTKAAVLFLPVVGAVIGVAECLLLAVARMAAFPVTVTALLFLVLPILFTGGIHLDGLIDTADARHSFGDREEKLRILKDPHVGAFGIIRLCLYLLLMLAALLLIFDSGFWAAPQKGEAFATVQPAEQTYTFLLFALPREAAIPLPFMLSRALTALASVTIPNAKKSGLLQTLSREDDRRQKAAAWIEVILLSIISVMVMPLPAALPLLGTQALWLYLFHRFSLKQFGGITGDLAGWFLCISELLFAGTLVVAMYLYTFFFRFL